MEWNGYFLHGEKGLSEDALPMPEKWHFNIKDMLKILLVQKWDYMYSEVVTRMKIESLPV